MAPTVLAVGLAIRAYGGTKSNRPGIVLRVFEVDGEWWAYVAFGTSEPQSMTMAPTPVFVDHSTPGDVFTQLGLDTPTWFTKRGGERMRDNEPSVRIVGVCPPATLVRVRELFGFR